MSVSNMNIHIYIHTHAVVKCLQRQASPEVNIYGINQAGLFRGTLMKALTRSHGGSAARSIIPACGGRDGCRGRVSADVRGF